MLLGRILRSPDGGEGGGGAAPDPKVEADEKGSPSPPNASMAEKMIAEHGSAVSTVLTLMDEIYKARQSKREMKGKIPPEGSVILQGEDAKHWGHYRDLGKPSDLKAALGERDEYRGKVEKFERRDFMDEVGKVANWKPRVLETLAARDGLKIEIVDSTEKGKDGRVITGSDGKPVRVAVVKGDGDSVVNLADYAAANWGDFLPSLVVASEKKPNGTPTVDRQRIQPGQGQGPQQATKRRIPSSF